MLVTSRELFQKKTSHRLHNTLELLNTAAMAKLVLDVAQAIH
jgi:hypothetical protein